jgi:hypothetical protein
MTCIVDDQIVYLVWHVHLNGSEENIKLIGIYVTKEDAEAALSRVKDQPGFRECPEGFEISEFEVGKDHWAEGYMTVP